MSVSAFVAHDFCIMFKNSFQSSIYKVFSCMFPSKSFMVSGLTFMSSIHFECISLFCMRRYVVCPALFLKETILSPLGSVFTIV